MSPIPITSSVSISDPAQASTSSDNLLAYRPDYADTHNSSLGVVFLNLNGVFMCVPPATNIPCGIVLTDTDGFFGGRSILQTADAGNNIRIFSSTEDIHTYGLAIEGCPQLNPTCWPDYADIGITCQLPRQYCGE